MVFGDERDNVIARLNQLQAMLGAGTGFSALGAVNYTPDNAFSRFRGIAYNVLPTSSEADGLVCIEITKPFSEVIPIKQGIQDHLFRLLGGRPNYQLVIEEIRPASLADTNTEVIIKVVERQASGKFSCPYSFRIYGFGLNTISPFHLFALRCNPCRTRQ